MAVGITTFMQAKGTSSCGSTSLIASNSFRIGRRYLIATNGSEIGYKKATNSVGMRQLCLE
eukprot:CAMPEP_0168762290 /NCGR_PEP_ID=MMETSP0724-20121128/23764_1 /TAXON_ID=265536 /ORGANISM="Amphiprora sp., Strain CCMP467" /LENGTH=60 /DNA_ID=CAMNT_0008811443 /DNA_START=237 /DNA_END=419 /DNA_ORIENTATION=+